METLRYPQGSNCEAFGGEYGAAELADRQHVLEATQCQPYPDIILQQMRKNHARDALMSVRTGDPNDEQAVRLRHEFGKEMSRLHDMEGAAADAILEGALPDL